MDQSTNVSKEYNSLIVEKNRHIRFGNHLFFKDGEEISPETNLPPATVGGTIQDTSLIDETEKSSCDTALFSPKIEHTSSNRIEKPFSRREARFSLQDELKQFQRPSTPKSTKKKIKHWLVKSVTKSCSAESSNCKYIPAISGNKSNQPSSLSNKIKDTIVKENALRNMTTDKEDKNSESNHAIWTRVSGKDLDQEKFEEEVHDFEKRFSAFDLDFNDYSHDVVHMRKLRKKRFLIAFLILACVMVAGLLAGYETAETESKRNSDNQELTGEETTPSIISNKTAQLDPGYSFEPKWDELCTQENLLNNRPAFNDCEKICEDFSCCHHPKDSIERCFKKKPDICQKVNEMCAQIVGIEESLKHQVPEPSSIIASDCAISSVRTESGREKCENKCFPGACCNADPESGINCNKGNNLEACAKYSICSNLLSGYDPELVTQECRKAEMNVESFNECSEMCESYMCCFRGDIQLHCKHNKDQCGQFSSCKILVDIFDKGLEPGS